MYYIFVRKISQSTGLIEYFFLFLVPVGGSNPSGSILATFLTLRGKPNLTPLFSKIRTGGGLLN